MNFGRNSRVVKRKKLFEVLNENEKIQDNSQKKPSKSRDNHDVTSDDTTNINIIVNEIINEISSENN